MLFWDVASEKQTRVFSYVCQKFITKGEKETKEASYFFPRRHEVLVGFEDVRQSLLDVFLLHAGQHGGGQEQRETPLLSAEI